jgi:hypothetical protein
MPVNLREARALCTKTELQLVLASRPAEVKQLSPSRLKAKIARARKLRDKYRDLARRQRGEARGKRSPRGARAAKGNVNTVKKAELFADTLARFQDALGRREAKAAKTAGWKQKPKSKPKSAPKPKPGRKAAKRNSIRKGALTAQEEADEALFRRKVEQFARSAQKRIFAHISSRGRRRQARRDQRR